jgi:hypothetical protein
MDGRGFTTYIIERLCRVRWSLSLALPLVTVLREMSCDMDGDQGASSFLCTDID